MVVKATGFVLPFRIAGRVDDAGIHLWATDAEGDRVCDVWAEGHDEDAAVTALVHTMVGGGSLDAAWLPFVRLDAIEDGWALELKLAG